MQLLINTDLRYASIPADYTEKAKSQWRRPGYHPATADQPTGEKHEGRSPSPARRGAEAVPRPVTNEANTTEALQWTTRIKTLETLAQQLVRLNPINYITTMNKSHGPKTCTTNLEKYLPDTYQQINHNTVAEMLENEHYLHLIHTIQTTPATDLYQYVSTQEPCHHNLSIPTTYQQIQLLPSNQIKMTNSEYLLKIYLQNFQIKKSKNSYQHYYAYRKNILSWNKTLQQIFHDWNTSLPMHQTYPTHTQKCIPLWTILTDTI